MKRFDVRIAVGSLDGPHSNVWRFWSRKAEVYAAQSAMGGVEKFSFHTPNICRRAFTKEHGTPITLNDRATHRWLRDVTSTAGVVRVLRVGFATDLLSTALAPPKRSISWIKPAPSGWSTVIDLMFTREDETTLLKALTGERAEIGHRLVAYKRLPNGEAFCVSVWYADRADTTLRMPADQTHKEDLIVFPKDPDLTGRPVRLTLFSNPSDGQFMQAWEYGAYWQTPLTDDEWNTMRQSLLGSDPSDARNP